ncbi:MAG: selenium cofactor biosynthesis protein YqeC [Chloroflexota bacterium]
MPGEAITLKEAFSIQPGEIISLVGAGGKTTLMSALAKELASENSVVISTTTTKIFDWQVPGDILIVEKDEDKMLGCLPRALQEHRHITLASERLSAEGKLKGISPELVIRIAGLKQVDYIIIEADGAARKPLKAPNTTEPVISQATTLVIAIVGIDALGLKLTKENVFRPEIASRLTGLPPGDIISADTIATLITHNEGITKGSPPSARIIPIINKVDLAEDATEAEALVYKILEAGHPHIERVVLGQLKSAEPVVKVIQAP